LIFAIGDIHGQLDLLEAAAAAIRRYSPTIEKHVVMLGDYVDRGADSSGVVRYLSSRGSKALTCLRGNHEHMMVRALALRTTKEVGRWAAQGGGQTLRSYGAHASDLDSLDRVPYGHTAWLGALPHLAMDKYRVYVHAGVLPNVSLREQPEQALLWIRERFLEVESAESFPDGKHVVHGHTPAWKKKPEPGCPELLKHRTNLDTGAYATGILSVGVFEADRPGGPVDLLSINKP
jgi:serine/threonine protein phosphatase 1